MYKKEVLLDTGFLEKLSCDGKNLETFKKVLSDLKFKPVVHPYIAANELDMYSYFFQHISYLVQKIPRCLLRYTDYF